MSILGKGEKMAHSLFHAKSSTRKFGGDVEDYLPIHNWFDATKSITASFRHRALRHHKQGIELCKQIFNDIKQYNDPVDQYYCTNVVTIDQIGEQHLNEDFQACPDASQWYTLFQEARWMTNSTSYDKISKALMRKFGGKIEDYRFLYDFFAQFNTDDHRSKMILNHSWGIFDAETVFGITFFRDSDDKEMPTRTVAESIISTKFGFIPTALDWVGNMEEDSWMYSKALALSKTL